MPIEMTFFAEVSDLKWLIVIVVMSFQFPGLAALFTTKRANDCAFADGRFDGMACFFVPSANATMKVIVAAESQLRTKSKAASNEQSVH